MRSTDQHFEQHEDADGPGRAVLVLLDGSSAGLDGVSQLELVARSVADAVPLDSLDVHESPRRVTPYLPIGTSRAGT